MIRKLASSEKRLSVTIDRERGRRKQKRCGTVGIHLPRWANCELGNLRSPAIWFCFFPKRNITTLPRCPAGHRTLSLSLSLSVCLSVCLSLSLPFSRVCSYQVARLPHHPYIPFWKASAVRTCQPPASHLAVNSGLINQGADTLVEVHDTLQRLILATSTAVASDG